jgi:hypothetical protein
MKILFCATALLLALIAGVGLIDHYGQGQSRPSQAALDQKPMTDRGTRPVIVELFTSEGCSSCPPADSLLSRLQESQPIPGVEIITLSEHVDYWNHLGWKDPYSSSQFTARQQHYADIFRGEDPYTPQMMVDGQKGFVGSNESEARKAIAQEVEAPSANVTLSLDSGSSKTDSNHIAFLVRVDNVASTKSGGPLEVLLAITESGLRSSVKRGENSGRTLLHTSVVRKLMPVGTVNPKSGESFTAQPIVQISNSWKRDQLTAVAFVQAKSNLRILGAADLRISQ